MKKSIIIMGIAASFIFTNCSKKEEDPVNELSLNGCLATLTRLSANDDNDDFSCAELISELNDLERSCNAILDAETKASIAILKASCEDN